MRISDWSSDVCSSDLKQLRVFTPRAPQGEMLDENILASLGSGYIRRADTVLPRQGRALPWRVLHNYSLDRPMLLKEAIDDGRLEFVPASAAASAAKVSLAACDPVPVGKADFRKRGCLYSI